MSKYANLFRSLTEGETAREDERGAPAGRFRLIFVDDEENVLKALRRVFLEENYDILTAAGGAEALDILTRERIHLVMSDYLMPGMNGVELLREVRQRYPETIRIMLTGHADIHAIMGAVSDGAVYKFITKPWNDEDLRLTVSLALQQYALIQENKTLKDITHRQQDKIKNLAALSDKDRKVLGNLLVKLGVITPEDLARAHREMLPDEFLTETLARLGLAGETKVIKALQGHLKMDFIDLKETRLHLGVVQTLPREFCERNRLIPIRLDGRQLVVAMADPADILVRDNIEFLTGLRAVPLIAGSGEIRAALREVYGEKGEGEFREADLLTGIEPMDEIDIVIEEDDEAVNVQELLNSSEVPPIIRVVNAIISEAVSYRASDIHIEPKTKYSLVRFRIDGILHNKIKIPLDYHASTLSRIKILAKMDISERRRPQDGRFSVKSGTRLVDIRVSTLPTISGEKATLRIMDKSAAIRDLNELGVMEDDLGKIQQLIRKPQGIIIATGPTGSGKTTMLYSILNTMLQSTKNFETIEDPVEYFLEDANQVYVRERVGLSFANVLRSTLRQDPDVILVGEIRDLETADVVFKAGLTGHMVLTTLHTNNAVASITRLVDIGVRPYLIASGLEGIIAQRLVRRVCRACKVETEPDPNILALLNLDRQTVGEIVWKGSGCRQCNNTGYAGRTGIYEVFLMDDDLRHLIDTDYREAEVLTLALSLGMRTLLQDGVVKVRRGDTTVEEILRILGPQVRYGRACDRCGKILDTKFLYCPFCGSFNQSVCRGCRKPLETDWLRCPFCGLSRGED